MTDTQELVSLGFRDVAPAQKTEAVGEIFARVARRYDLMNDLMSGGMHRLWKNEFVGRVCPREGEHILDLAGGTGDIAFRMVKSGADVVVADINPGMLAVGRERAEKHGPEKSGPEKSRRGGLRFVEANAEAMPFADRDFDAVTIAFGIRNVTDIPKALRDIHRVLKWGGRFYCLEFSSTEWPGFGTLYDRYSMAMVPKIGGIVAKDEDAYQYLVESIRRFPKMPKFAAMIEAAGFRRVSVVPILGGAVAIHSGWKV